MSFIRRQLATYGKQHQQDLDRDYLVYHKSEAMYNFHNFYGFQCDAFSHETLLM